MLKIENVEIAGLEPAIRGMRNPMNSWDKSDSGLTCPNGEYNMGIERCSQCVVDVMSCENVPYFAVGPTDLQTMKNLSNGGPVHGKFKRMIKVYMDITAPLYWWKEFDTYKVGTNCDSCSTMHKIHAKRFYLQDFSAEHLDVDNEQFMLDMIVMLNRAREQFIATGNKKWWWQMIQLLPSSYNQRRTVELNYEVLTAMYRDRKNHKLDEWRTLCERVEELPYSELITTKPTYI